MGKAKLTPEGWRCDKEGEHLYRPKWVDFQDPAIHLLTLVTSNRQPLFGALEGEQIALTPLGQFVADEIMRIPSYKGAKDIEIYRYVVMPDHIHILLRIHERLPKHLGQYVRWFKRQCDGCLSGGVAPKNEEQEETPTADCQLLGATPPSAPTPDCQSLGANPPSNHTTLFAPEYHTRTLSGRNQLTHMARYIDDNPRRLALKRANPDIFRIHQQTDVCGVLCTTLGNMFLAENPMREALHCSRSLTQAEIDSLKEQCLSHAANGTIYISPAVSEGEKQICRAIREAGFPLIIVLSEGFPAPDSPHYKYYKPKGVYFEACAAGKLLLIQPDAALFERKDIEEKVYTKTGIRDLPHDAKRYRFVAQNAIADLIAQL